MGLLSYCRTITMEDRRKHLDSVINAEGVLERVLRSAGLTLLDNPSAEKALKEAALLETEGSPAARSRAAFIRTQLRGDTAEAFFARHREEWGIPEFEEELVTAADFKDGFMWRFQDHTTSWSENQYAQQWFLTSWEARTVTQYEFWSCDEGPAECIDTVKGSYKQILTSLLEAGVYEVLISPAFTSAELDSFINSYPEQERDFDIEEIIDDYISLNPNYAAK